MTLFSEKGSSRRGRGGPFLLCVGPVVAAYAVVGGLRASSAAALAASTEAWPKPPGAVSRYDETPAIRSVLNAYWARARHGARGDALRLVHPSLRNAWWDCLAGADPATTGGGESLTIESVDVRRYHAVVLAHPKGRPETPLSFGLARTPGDAWRDDRGWRLNALHRGRVTR